MTAPATTDAIWLVEEVVAVAQRLSAYWSIATVSRKLHCRLSVDKRDHEISGQINFPVGIFIDHRSNRFAKQRAVNLGIILRWVRNELVSLLEAGDEILQLRAPATK